jgi:hypothetical protein
MRACVCHFFVVILQRKIPRSSRFRSAEDYDKLQQDTQRVQEDIVRELKALMDNHGFKVTKINNKEV